eukprot:m.76468 g.76468  ORF g.76468 m.76468 type:complete len:176 (+) comp12560_c0_seq3:106-633(+)
MFLNTIILFLGCFLLAQGSDFHYMMQYESQCNKVGSSTFSCMGKANSQDITVLIDNTDALTYQVKSAMGSYSSWEYTITVDGTDLGTEQGNFSFGTHLSRDHSFKYSSATVHMQVNPYQPEVYTITTANVTGGQGVFQGASGYLAYTCVSDQTYSESTCSVSVIVDKGSQNKKLN